MNDTLKWPAWMRQPIPAHLAAYGSAEEITAWTKAENERLAKLTV